MTLPSHLIVRPSFFNHAFISYPSVETKSATRLTQTLQSYFGVRAWLDSDNGEFDRAPRTPGDGRGKPIPGENSVVESVLGRAIFDSILLVVLSSPRVLDSIWVRKEIVIAERLNKPIFFWHISEEGEAQTISIRRSGPNPNPDLAFHRNLETVGRSYETAMLATSQAVDFVSELSSRQDSLNIVGHSIEPSSRVETVAGELNILIELCELILSRGVVVNAASIQQFWPEFETINQRCDELEELIATQYGEEITAGRTPVAHAFQLKRPFVLQKITHLERILNDQDYRLAEFRMLKAKRERSDDKRE